MKIKKILIILLILLLGGLLTLKFGSRMFINSDTLFGRISNILNRNNKIELNCSGIEKKSIDVYWNYEINGKPIIKSGEQISKIGHEYGNNRFSIKTGNDLEFKVGHFKYNNWHSHNYEIDLAKDSSGYKLKFIANGPDFEWNEHEYNLSGELNGLVCGFFKNGSFAYKGNFASGLRQGQFIYYHQNGKIRSTIDYLDNELHGYETYFDKYGKIRSKAKYVRGQKIEKNE